jgi:hypothetical protein
VDANVFYDLICDGRPHGEDTKVLEADWLHDSITLCITQEIYNEIDRCPTEIEKNRARIAAQRFRELKPDEATVRSLEGRLAPLFDNLPSERERSDLRHVARAIAAEVPFLVTRDAPLLGRSDPIFEQYDLRILHPTDLINRFDALRREAEYRPSRLEGSTWRERLVVAEDVPKIVSLFKNNEERNGPFEQSVRHYVANSHEWASVLVAKGNEAPIVYFVRSSTGTANVQIPLLRHLEHPLAGTIVRHIVHQLSGRIGPGTHKVISVLDPRVSEEAIAAFKELGFVYDSEAWWKMSIRGVVARDEIVSTIRGADIPLSLKERLVGANFLSGAEDPSIIVRVEHLFSPVKLKPSSLPDYIVSIWQSWAAHFFDIPEGGQTLWDLNERLHLGIEGIYYCSANNKHVTAPGHILWYVSGEGSMSVKACSRLEEVITGPAKEVFVRFRHLGVFEWKHVLEAAGGEPNGLLMAFRFSQTERFAHPIPLLMLQEMGIPQPQNPRRITHDQFVALYRLGMAL